MIMQDILSIEDLHYHYGANYALRGINIRVGQGEIVALIGSNGAGKTTTLRCISGLLGKPTRGKIILAGENVVGMRAEKIASMGLAHVLEGRHIFPKLTVWENLLMGAFNKAYPFREGLK
mgnify:FL=1